MFDKLVEVTNFLWGIPLTLFVVIAGLYLCYICKFIQFTKIKTIWKNTFGKKNKNDNDKRTINTVLAGTIGSGNIAGIASAIAVGGPGAIFWMWVIALISMAIKFAEVTLAVKYREKNEDGSFIGGPMFYIKKIFGKFGKILAIIYSLGLLLLVVSDSGFVQINTLATSINSTFNVPLLIIALILIPLSIFIINKGFKRTSDVLRKMVPIMTITFVITAIIIIIVNIKRIPESLLLIIKYAFSPAPVIGGFAGATVMSAISKGAARGIFANEAGMGTTTTVYATSKEKNPVRMGMWGIAEVAIVSFIMCTLTGLVVITSGAWTSGDTGSVMVLNAYESVYGNLGKYIMCIIIVLFAYSTFLGFYVEFKTSITYLFGEKSLKILKWLYYVPIIFATLMPIEAIWSIADMAVGFIVIPNIIALICLSKNFREIYKEGIKEIESQQQRKLT